MLGIKKTNQGFSLLEAVISLGVFSFLVLSVTSLALGSYSFFSYGKSLNQAEALAHEAVEAVRALGGKTWNELTFTESAVDFASGQWLFLGEGTTEQAGSFARSIRFNPVFRDDSGELVSSSTPGAHEDVLSKLVSVIISWSSDRDSPQALIKTFLVTALRSQAWIRDSWSGGDGQDIDVDPTKYLFADNISASSSGLKLDKISILSSAYWDFADSGSYIFDSAKISVDNQASLVATSVSRFYASANSDFSTSTVGWSSPLAWGQSPGEVVVAGSRLSSGGNAGGFYRFEIPRGTNDQVGGWIEMPFVITEPNPSNQRLQLDWSLLRKMKAAPDKLGLYVFIDKSPGAEPAIGSASQVWASPDLSVSALTDWSSQDGIDISSVASTSGAYIMKVAVWADTPPSASGEFWIGVDNVQVTWEWTGAAFPIDKPSIQAVDPIVPGELYSWHSFSEDATKNSGEIYYQLSPDNMNWLYWDGAAWANAASANFNTALEVSIQIYRFSTSTKRLYIRSFLASNNNEQLSLDAVRVTYFRASPPSWGNNFLVSADDQTPLTATNTNKTAFRFAPGQNRIIDRLGLYPSSYSGSGPAGNYRVGIQADDNGVPSGTYLGSAVYLSTAVNNWVVSTISPPVSLAADKFYHVVIQREVGNRSRRFRTVLPDNDIDYFSGAISSSSLLTTLDGSNWVDQGQVLSYLLYSPDGTVTGNPVYGADSARVIYGGNRISESFLLPGHDIEPLGLTVVVRKTAAGIPGGDLFYAIQDAGSGGDIASGILVSKNSISQAYGSADIFFDEGLLLSGSSTYRLSFFAPSSTAANAYEMHVMNNDDIASMNAANFMGLYAQYEYSTTQGSSWVAVPNADLAFRLIYDSESSGLFEKEGYLISSAHFVPSAIFHSLDWQDDATCLNCTVKIWIKTAPDNGGVPGMWDAYWSGPNGKDGGESDYFMQKTGTLINANHNGDQWVRYKVQLDGNGDNTPSVKSIRINYKKL